MKNIISCFYCINKSIFCFGTKIAYYLASFLWNTINTTCPSASLSGGLFFVLSRTCQRRKMRAHCAQTLLEEIFYESLSLWLRP